MPTSQRVRDYLSTCISPRLYYSSHCGEHATLSSSPSPKTAKLLAPPGQRCSLQIAGRGFAPAFGEEILTCLRGKSAQLISRFSPRLVEMFTVRCIRWRWVPCADYCSHEVGFSRFLTILLIFSYLEFTIAAYLHLIHHQRIGKSRAKSARYGDNVVILP